METLPPEAGREELERELQDLRETHHATVEELTTSNEELKSSNEELQSTNEELHSSNEELESSREELQALNEELNTLNAELQSKIEALARSKDDMRNLVTSMRMATVFLDKALRVKFFTEEARELIRLIDSDVGRPLEDFSIRMNYEDLQADCREVLATLVPKERQIQDENGRWLLVRLLPYRTSDDLIDGLVLTFLDVDRVKKERFDLDVFRGIAETLPVPLLVLDTDLRVVRANNAFCRVFATDPSATEGCLLFQLGNEQWNSPELVRLLKEVLPEKRVVTEYRVEHTVPRIGRKTFYVNATRLMKEEEEQGLILLNFEEETGREE